MGEGVGPGCEWVVKTASRQAYFKSSHHEERRQNEKGGEEPTNEKTRD